MLEYSESKSIQVTEVEMGKYLDRGDPASSDFSSLICDGVWHELDLSGIVAPAGAGHLVHFIFCATFDFAGRAICFRKNGNAGVRNSAVVRSHIASDEMSVCESDLWVMMDLFRKIEYRADPAVKHISLVVRGWIED